MNIALPPGTGDAGWLRAIDAVVPSVVRDFAPDILVTQHGCDTHALDPLAHLEMSVDGQRAAAVALHQLAHEVAGGRWLALGGGGYAVLDVVPRTWSHLVAVAAHAPVDPSLTGAAGLARARPGPVRPAGPGDDGRRPGRLRSAGLAVLGVGGGSLGPGGPGGAGHPPGRLPPARAGPVVRLTGTHLGARWTGEPVAAHFPTSLTCPYREASHDVDVRRWGSRRYGACSKDRCSMASERQLAEVRFLTVAEVAAIMRVSKMTVYRLVHSGELPAVRVGRSFRVPEQAVHDYLKTSYVDTA